MSYLTYERGDKVLGYHVDKYGNSYVAGYYYENMNNTSVPAAFIRKYDASGNLLWSNLQSVSMYISTLSYHGSFATAVTSDDNGNVYVTGAYSYYNFYINAIVLNNPSNKLHGFVVKLDSSGIAQWIINITNDNASHGNEGPSDILYLNDNKIFFTTSGGPASIKFANGYTYTMPFSSTLDLITINSSGIFQHNINLGTGGLYNATIPYSNNPTDYQRIMVTPKMKFNHNNKIVLTASGSNLYLTNFTFANFTGGYVAIIDTALGIEKAFITLSPGVYAYTPYKAAIALDSYNNIYLSYVLNYDPMANDCDPDYNISAAIGTGPALPNSTHKSFLMKYDTAGTLLWYNMNTNFLTTSLSYINDNNLYAFGEFYEMMGISSQTLQSQGLHSNGNRDMFLASYTLTGDLNWVKPIGTSSPESAMPMTEDTCNRHLYFIGSLADTITFMNQTINANNQLVIFKFSPDTNCATIPCAAVPVSVNSQSETLNGNISAYPNPVISIVNLKLESNGRHTIRLNNTFGEILFQSLINSGQMKIDMSNFQKGIYFVTVTDESMHSVILKIVRM